MDPDSADDYREPVSSARSDLANSMADRKKMRGLLSGAAEGAAIGGNLGGMIGSMASSGHTKKQALDTGGNGAMDYFKSGGK